MSLKAELAQILYDLPLGAKPERSRIAHFCEHDGVRIRFHRARTTWLSITPRALKPWLMILEPLRNGYAAENDADDQERSNHNNNYKAEEVT